MYNIHNLVRRRLNNQVHPTTDLPYRWGRIPGYGMARVYDLAVAHINQEWMLQNQFPLTDEGYYRRFIQREAAHYLVRILTTENVSWLLFFIFSDNLLI
jgi:hypothetical protein